MENGTKSHISLSAGFDVTSSDMLVPVSSPLFQHNWQKYQGRCMPNSMRYEQDGWAVGWNVIDFEYSNDFLEVDGYYIAYNKIGDLPAYKINVLDDKDATMPVLSLDVITETGILLTDKCTATIGGNTVTGTFNDRQFMINWNQTEAKGTVTGEGYELSQALNTDGSVIFNIHDSMKSYSFSTAIHRAGDFKYGEFSIPFTEMTNDVQRWGDLVTFDGDRLETFGNDTIFSTDGRQLTADFSIKNTGSAQYVFTDTRVLVDEIESWTPPRPDDPSYIRQLISTEEVYASVLDKLSLTFSITPPSYNCMYIEYIADMLNNITVEPFTFSISKSQSGSDITYAGSCSISVNISDLVTVSIPVNVYKKIHVTENSTTGVKTTELIDEYIKVVVPAVHVARDNWAIDITGATNDNVLSNSNLSLQCSVIEGYDNAGADICYSYSDNDNDNVLVHTLTAEHVSFSVNNDNYEYVKSKQELVTNVPVHDFMFTESSDNILVAGIVDYGCSITCMMKRVFNDRFNSLIEYNGTLLKLSVRDDIVTFDLADMLLKRSVVNVMSTDIRRPDKTLRIGSIYPSDVMQLIRQQWNTTIEVENFWWIDSRHVLVLDNYHLTLRRKTQELDDWNGDKFEDIWVKSRHDYLGTDVDHYFMSNGYMSEPRLVVIKLASEYTMNVYMYDVLDDMSYVVFSLTLNKVNLGDKLNIDTTRLNTYSYIQMSSLLTHATFTATTLDGRLLFGIHSDSNFMQWVATVDLETGMVLNILQGYGYVGLKGELTGGQVPSDYFDARYGFTGTVYPFSKLQEVFVDGKDDNVYLNNTSLIVGTENACWYVKKQLSGIVSHLTYDIGAHTFVPKIMPVTNNYSAVYATPSFAAQIAGQLMIRWISLYSVVRQYDDGGAFSVLATLLSFIATNPTWFYFTPKYTTVAYAQQTLGQYSFVHYNTDQSLPRVAPKANKTITPVSRNATQKELQDLLDKGTSVLTEDSYAFGKKQYKQTVSCSLKRLNKIVLLMFIELFQHGISRVQKSLAINKETSQTLNNDKGRQLGQFVTDTVIDAIVQSLMSEGYDNAITSTVNSVLSLNMFYSNSDKQHVLAGPGFVEHQFVADCIAQSVTATHAEGTQLTLLFPLPQLSDIIQAVKVMALEKVAEAARKAADYMSNQFDVAMGTGGNTMFQAAALALNVVAVALNAEAKIARKAGEIMTEMAKTIFANGANSYQTNALSSHNISAEGQHRYGEKYETFMWPCWGVRSGGQQYTNEMVQADIKNTPWHLNMPSSDNTSSADNILINYSKIGSMSQPVDLARGIADIDHYTAMCRGVQQQVTLPEDMAMVIGSESLLPTSKFKNENIGAGSPAFAPSLAQDYVIDKEWQLSMYCTYGLVQWITVKDTKVIDCPPSNIVILENFLGIACPYTAVEVKKGFSKKYNRPFAITPTALAFNCTGYNTVFDNVLYHSFDGYSYRITRWVGEPGLGNNRQTFYYAFQTNDRFKRSNKLPANEVQGAFRSDPQTAISAIDDVWSLTTIAADEKGLEAGTIGEDKDLIRWAVPIFTEPVATLPAAVKTLTAMPLGVVEGITSLCTELANNQTAYKAPLSVDFALGKQMYRATEEYICQVNTESGIDVVTDIVPMLGLTYLGCTPTEAYFYSRATRSYYMFTGGSVLNKVDLLERFRSIQQGYYDFVNQCVIMPSLMTYSRINKFIKDTDTETDNIIVPVLSKSEVTGELPPPITTIFNDKSWYKVVSLPSGLAYQGPNRVIINRDVYTEYMTDTVKQNFGKWEKVPREDYNPVRRYSDKYNSVDKNVDVAVKGWTHNPFLLVTSPLGLSEDTDCLFEWNITFCWTVEMSLLYEDRDYAVVNIMAETMTPGGKMACRPTHIFLTKELFTRNGAYGYYSFRYQSKNGVGNRERLHIWSDAYIAVSSIDCEYKVVTQRRTEQLTQQVDVHGMKEL